ncbi:MAG: ABC transporter substrate-binding protein [candidate division Zixibacteria bacterium]|nr:ABC transporter substrate-binding protein [candidate division Zixibacteria bacterium]
MVIKNYTVPFAALLVVVFYCCGKPAPRPAAGETRPFTDDLGRAVAVPVAPRRIISTSPEMTELLFAVGAGSRVVGVVRGCDWPPAARALPSVGDFSNVSIERVAALEPDLIITTGHEQKRIVAQLESLGVPTVAFLASDIAAFRRNVKAVGVMVGEERRATALLAEFDAELSAVESEAGDVPAAARPRVYLEISPEPLMTVAEGSFVHEAISLAGGVNVGAGLPRPYSRIDPEAVIARDPEVIILCHDAATPEVVAARTGWSRVAAVEEGRIYKANPDLVLRAGPRLGEGVALLHDLFYRKRGARQGWK